MPGLKCYYCFLQCFSQSKHLVPAAVVAVSVLSCPLLASGVPVTKHETGLFTAILLPVTARHAHSGFGTGSQVSAKAGA